MKKIRAGALGLGLAMSTIDKNIFGDLNNPVRSEVKTLDKVADKVFGVLPDRTRKARMPLNGAENESLKSFGGKMKRLYVLYLKTKYDFPRTRDVSYDEMFYV